MKKAQTSIEIIVLSSIILLITSFLFVSYIQIPTFSSMQEEQSIKRYFAQLPVGILSYTENQTHSQITFYNSFAEPVELLYINESQIIFIHEILQPSQQRLVIIPQTDLEMFSYSYRLLFTNITRTQQVLYEYPR
ncbi:MAG: hypothetical protein ACMXYA_02945 [Candidatus Woesearchaeota archaeon]